MRPTVRALPLLAAVLLGAALAPAWAGAGEAVRARETLCFAERVCIETIEYGRWVEIWLDHRGAGPVTVAFNPQADAVIEDLEPIHRRLRGATRMRLLTMTGRAKDAPWQWSWRITVHPGIVARAHDQTAVYELPFAPGETFYVSQGFEGDLSHQGHDRYAVDFPMPEGTGVHAARGGRVIAIREDSGSALDGQHNYVCIRHDDGTIGQYLHLRPGGALVEPGQRVAAGDLIGLSGSTGKSTGPHLHFHVSTPAETGPSAFTTFPVRFRTQYGIAEPRQGQWYTRPP